MEETSNRLVSFKLEDNFCGLKCKESSAERVKALLKDSVETRSLLITSAFHMRRSKACFKKAGLPVDLFSTDFYSHPRYYTPDTLLVPQAEAITIWQKLFKEWTGMVAYKAAGYI